MFEEIAKKAGLKYDLYQTPGNSYGRLSEKGQWDGAVKELIEKVFRIWHKRNVPHTNVFLKKE